MATAIFMVKSPPPLKLIVPIATALRINIPPCLLPALPPNPADVI